MKYQNQIYNIQGIIYQEKDWGNSFPKKYIWVQSNCCLQKKQFYFYRVPQFH
ncbi:tocopherol cyclase family protein [Coprobacillus cateniformis]